MAKSQLIYETDMESLTGLFEDISDAKTIEELEKSGRKLRMIASSYDHLRDVKENRDSFVNFLAVTTSVARYHEVVKKITGENGYILEYPARLAYFMATGGDEVQEGGNGSRKKFTSIEREFNKFQAGKTLADAVKELPEPKVIVKVKNNHKA